MQGPLDYAGRMEELDTLDETTAALAAATALVDVRRGERSAALAAAFEAGVSMGALAERIGVSDARIGQILGYPRGRVGRPAADDA